MVNIMAAMRIFLMLALLWLPKAVNASQEHVSAGYRITEINELADGSGVVANLKLISGSDTYGPDLEDLRLTARYEEHGRVHVHITDATQARYEVPTLLIPRARIQDVAIGSPASGDLETVPGSHVGPLQISWKREPFSFAVTRRETGEALFNTTDMPLVFKDQYLEFATQLPKESFLYGLGDSTRPAGMRLKQGSAYTLFATDVGCHVVDIALYSAHPFVLDMRPGGRASAFLFMNSNGMDVTYARDDVLNFKVIGGVMDFYFFPGPSPLAVLDQYTSLVGRPAAMPYWSLGFHQSRYGYKNHAELESVVARFDEIKFPLESIWVDIDHMDNYKDFTLDPVKFPEDKMNALVEHLHAKDQKIVFIVDPGIAIDENYPTYTRGLELGVYMLNGSVGGEGYYTAQVWPGFSTIPDFLHPNAVDWWAKELDEFHKLIPYDGLWLDMNEPANFCSGSLCWLDSTIPCEIIDECCMACDNRPEVLQRWDNPPYKINAVRPGHGDHVPVYLRTVAMTAQHYDGSRMYDTHNVYGMSQVRVTLSALHKVGKKRPFVLSRSGFVGSSAYTARWTGDNAATFEDMQYSIVDMLNSGLFGAPMVGADICGYHGDPTEDLCGRWAQLGAFYPFSRSHGDAKKGNQEFYLWESVAKTSADIFYWRYRLLPYFYTLFYEGTLSGAPYVRPLFFHYPEDTETWGNDRQFLLGNALLVSPVLEEAQTSVRAYFPKGIWHNLFDKSIIRAVDHGVWETLPAAWDQINVHIRQGSIVPMQEFAVTTTAARKTPFTLLVALAENCAAPYSIVCDSEVATGELFVDDDDDQLTMALTPGRASHIKWEAVRTDARYVVRSIVTEPDFVAHQALVIDTISVLGVQSQPSGIHLNGLLAAVNVKLDTNSSTLEFSGLHLPLGKDFELVWNSLATGNIDQAMKSI